MKTFKLKKLWHGFATLKDFDAMEAVKRGGAIVEYEGKRMTLSVEQLQKGFQVHGKRFISQIKGWVNPIDGTNTYGFIDYKFIEDKEGGV